MYNLYIHEKQLSDFEKATDEKKRILKIDNKRKRKINYLTNKYNMRMKNFVLSLCENPIILGRYTNDNDNNDYKSIFAFGDYMTDKKKVELINQEKMILKKYEEINKKIQKRRDLLNAKKNNNIIIFQPRMRFGPHEEIESIVDSINQNRGSNLNKKYNKILNDHLKKLKDNNVRYIKRYDMFKSCYGDNYNDIKKYLLKDEYKENEFSYKKVIGSKLSNSVNNEELDYNKKNILEFKDPDVHISNKDDQKEAHITEKIFRKTNKNIYSVKTNELKKLFNDNRKLYFKGASQYISLKLENSREKRLHNGSSDDLQDQDISVIYTDKNIYFKKGSNFLIKNRKKIKKTKLEKHLEKQKSMPDIINDKHKNPKINMNIFSPSNKNQSINGNNYLNKYLSLDYAQKNKNNTPLNRIVEDNLAFEDNHRGLCEESKIKKLKMNNLIKNEINKSIVNNYIDKYDIIKEFNKHNTINTNSLYFQSYNNHITEKRDEHLKEKLKYLIKIIRQKNRENTKDNNITTTSNMNSPGLFKFSHKKEKKKIKNTASSDYVLIDGQFISKKDIKAVSDAIFTKCNFYKKKKIHSQRNTLKKNENLENPGLTVNNFYSKLSL
jgi:hypothetical protein